MASNTSKRRLEPGRKIKLAGLDHPIYKEGPSVYVPMSRPSTSASPKSTAGASGGTPPAGQRAAERPSPEPFPDLQNLPFDPAQKLLDEMEASEASAGPATDASTPEARQRKSRKPRAAR
jgi:hypothetical protein